MVTSEELVVAIKSEGVNETQDQLEGVERSMDDTAKAAGDSAEELEGFSQRFSGAISAAVAALATGAAGLLTQIPVLGEAFAGLAAIVEALAFQMDSVLRPVLSPITSFFFDIASAIFEADGVFGSFIGTLSTLASLFVIAVAGAATLLSQLGAVSGIGAGVVGIFKAIGAAIVALVGLFGGLTLAAVALGLALTAFAIAMATNFRGMRDKTREILLGLVETIVGGVNDMVNRALDAVSSWTTSMVSWFTDLAADLSSWASDLASDAYQWGASVINRFIDGIRSAISELRSWLSDLRDVGATVGVDVPSVGGGGGGDGGGGGRSGPLPFRGGGSGSGTVTMDGRQLSESTGRYRSDPSRRQGL